MDLALLILSAALTASWLFLAIVHRIRFRDCGASKEEIAKLMENDREQSRRISLWICVFITSEVCLVWLFYPAWIWKHSFSATLFNLSLQMIEPIFRGFRLCKAVVAQRGETAPERND
jgi:hypothetical protein